MPSAGQMFDNGSSFQGADNRQHERRLRDPDHACRRRKRYRYIQDARKYGIRSVSSMHGFPNGDLTSRGIYNVNGMLVKKTVLKIVPINKKSLAGLAAGSIFCSGFSGGPKAGNGPIKMLHLRFSKVHEVIML